MPAQGHWQCLWGAPAAVGTATCGGGAPWVNGSVSGLILRCLHHRHLNGDRLGRGRGEGLPSPPLVAIIRIMSTARPIGAADVTVWL